MDMRIGSGNISIRAFSGVNTPCFLEDNTLVTINTCETVALDFGLLSWGNLIFNNIIDLCCIIFMCFHCFHVLYCKKTFIKKVT